LIALYLFWRTAATVSKSPARDSNAPPLDFGNREEFGARMALLIWQLTCSHTGTKTEPLKPNGDPRPIRESGSGPSIEALVRVVGRGLTLPSAMKYLLGTKSINRIELTTCLGVPR
jgi:hypothetical protein